MAKRPAKFEEYVAPWETKKADGEIEVGEVDPARLKKYLYDLLGDKEKAESDAQAAKEEVKTLKKEKEDAAHAGDDELTKANRRAEQAEQKAKEESDKREAAELDKARAEVAIEKGLTVKQAARLQGKNKDELLTDADVYIEENGIKVGEDESDEDGGVPSRKPVASGTPKTPGDPAPGAGKETNPEDWAKAWTEGRAAI